MNETEAKQAADFRQQAALNAATPKPRAGEHTKGPWRVHTSGSIYAGASYVATTVGEADQADLNARRIAACVNACEGIDDPETEISEMRECVRLLGEEQNAAAERDLLRERGRELVAMLQVAAGELDHAGNALLNCSQSKLAEHALKAGAQASALLAKHGR